MRIINNNEKTVPRLRTDAREPGLHPALPDVPALRRATDSAPRAYAFDARGIGGEAAHSARGLDGHGTPGITPAGPGRDDRDATGPDAWPGWQWGVRAPEGGETPLSMAEVLHALKIKLISGDNDEIDKWPAVRIYRTAGAWVSATPGAPRASLFDWLVTA